MKSGNLRKENLENIKLMRFPMLSKIQCCPNSFMIMTYAVTKHVCRFLLATFCVKEKEFAILDIEGSVRFHNMYNLLV